MNEWFILLHNNYSNNSEKEWQLYIKIIIQYVYEGSVKKLIVLDT